MASGERRVLWFEDVGRGDIGAVGGKNASLGEMVRALAPKGIRIPPGFATTANAYLETLRQERPVEDRYLLTAGALRHRIAVLLAGRAAEELTFDDVSTGAADDLVKATDLARQMVCRYGMSRDIGNVSLERTGPGWLSDDRMLAQGRDHSEATAREVDIAVRDIVSGAHQMARQILMDSGETLDQGAALLMAQEVLTPDQFPALRQIGTSGSA